MSFKIYNELTRKKEIFKPIKKQVGMYTCGPTVYNFVHIGNLRAYVFADIFRKYLKFSGYNVKSVMNITDVEDKTIKKSQEEGVSLKELTRKYEVAFLKDIDEMNVELPEIVCRATENIPEMIKIIKTLIKKGFAYETNDGIYFSIKKFNDYGKLSNVKVKELKVGASQRVGKDDYAKEDASDFALWKFYREEDGEVFWETEIGKGRPGWHIECSAMSSKYLGEQFDIHLGGVDLRFPHHENEIAQSEATFGKSPWVKYWLHNEWVLVDGKKMSKSLNNFYKLSDIKDSNYSPLDLRYFFLTKIYGQQINFTWKELEASKTALQRLRNICQEIKGDKNINEKYLAEFKKAMDDDLNTPKGLQVLWKLVRDEKAEGKYRTIQKIDEVFSLELIKEKIKTPEEVMKLVEEREKARKEKNWKKSDELRDEIKSKGYVVNDTASGPVVSKI